MTDIALEVLPTHCALLLNRILCLDDVMALHGMTRIELGDYISGNRSEIQLLATNQKLEGNGAQQQARMKLPVLLNQLHELADYEGMAPTALIKITELTAKIAGAFTQADNAVRGEASSTGKKFTISINIGNGQPTKIETLVPVEASNQWVEEE